MKKNLRKIVSLVLILAMALTISVPAFAAEHTNRPIIGLGITEKATNSDSITPFFQEVCNGKPYHDMVSRSYGNAYIRLSDGSLETYISWGACWQCKACNMVMITEHDIIPDYPTAIGKYAVLNYNEPINLTGTDIVTSRNQTNYTGSNSISGYKFRYGDL